ncbi:tatD [Mytilus coruscus]|uniref:TatD n=1 Tax=Mytilus coruscus TaxID=42192 RepID=A0A6J8AAR5_MYTCO|nr:tatD [Mytilus coruscus]
MSLLCPSPTRSLPGLGSRSSPLSLGARESPQTGDSPGSRGTESRLCRDLSDAFDSHMHLDRSLSKMGMPPRTSLGDFLRMRLTLAPVDPVKLAGGVVVFCDPKTWPSVPLRQESGWVEALEIHPKSAGQFEDAVQHRFHKLVSHRSVSSLGDGVDLTAEEKLHARWLSTLRWALQSCRFDQPVVLHVRGDRLDKVHARAHREVLGVMTGMAINPVQLIHLYCFQGGINQTVARENIWQLLPELHSHYTDRGDFAHSLAAGNIKIETTAPVNLHQQTEIDQRLKPALENLKKIINVFVEPNMDLKPKDVAQKSGLGKTAKVVNKPLYLLEKKKVLSLKKNADGTDPRWNRGPLTQYSEKDLLEWAAEIVHGSTTTTMAPTPVVNHHHHNHQHEHNTYVQVGDQNVIALDPNNQEGRREKKK